MAASTPIQADAPGALPTLAFAVRDAARAEHVAAPTLRFAVEVESLGGHAIRSILLDVQVQIAARRRHYEEAEHDRLFELFGPVSTWGSTLRTLLWTRATLVVPPFSGATVVDLPIACTYDLDVIAARYFAALQDGVVPLELLFSGTVFYTGAGGMLQTARISWEQEASYRLPVSVWRETMDHHFPGSAWLRLQRSAYDRLCAYKARNAFATWDDAIAALVPDRGPEPAPEPAEAAAVAPREDAANAGSRSVG